MQDKTFVQAADLKKQIEKTEIIAQNFNFLGAALDQKSANVQLEIGANAGAALVRIILNSAIDHERPVIANLVADSEKHFERRIETLKNDFANL